MSSRKLQSGLVAATLASLLCSTGHADKVYRTVDAQGIPSFSDQEEVADAEEIILQETATYPGESLPQSLPQAAPGSATVASLLSQQEPDYAPGYTEVAISYPPDKSAIRDNVGTLSLMVTTSPDIHPSHRAELLMDGKTIRTLQSAGAVILTHLDRGTHNFSVRILNQNDQEIASSATTSITLLRASQIKSNN